MGDRSSALASINRAALTGPWRALVLMGAGVLMLALTVALARLVVDPQRAALDIHSPALALAVHLACVVPAVPLGAFVLLRRKGDALHKALGRVWAFLMMGTALSSFGLTGLGAGAFSPIHLLSVLTLVTLPLAVIDARRGRIAAHRRTMVIIYVSMLVAGAFAFVPGRLLSQWLAG